MITKHRKGYLFKKGRSYYLQYMVDGRRFKQALKDKDGNPITNRKQAEAKRKEIMAPFMVAQRESVLRTVAHKLDDTIQEREALTHPDIPSLKIQDAWEAYVASVNRPDSGPRTLKGYKQQWAKFVGWMEREYPRVTAIADVGAEIAQGYAQYLLAEIKMKVKRKRGKEEWEEEKVVKRAYSTNTYNKHVRVLELVWRVLHNGSGVATNPWVAVARKAENRQSRRELTIEEINTIVNNADSELQVLLVLGIYTGLRLGDACTLHWSEVDLARGIILRVPNKTARRKNTPVHIPIHPTLRLHIETTPRSDGNGYVLPGFAARYERNTSAVSTELRKHFTECGIQVHRDGTGDGTGKRAVVEVGYHSLRHSFVSLCRQANTPLAVVEAIVGHSNPAMTRHYTHVGDLAASQAVAALPPIGESDQGSSRGDGEEGTHAADSGTGNKVRTQMSAILRNSSAKTWLRDRDQLLDLLQDGRES